MTASCGIAIINWESCAVEDSTPEGLEKKSEKGHRLYLAGHPKGHFATCCPEEGHPGGRFNMFYLPRGQRA